MSDQDVTLIVSDLHVGGGPTDAGDDHIYQKQQFVRFLREQAATPEAKGGRLELYFNGDFLEFAQADQAAFSHISDRYWCTQDESLAKLETIIAGHGDIFAELASFQHAGNRVTIAAGNHDVDLYWPQVQERLRHVAGVGLRFELGHEWVERYAGKLQIGHGHMSDPANRFEHWDDPILTSDWGFQCLEMCPGTLFMVKFVNKLEAKYPFADNLLPVTKLASVLLRDDKSGFASVGWTFSCFVGGSPLSVLQKGAREEQYGDRLLARIQNDPDFRAKLESALASAGLDDSLALLRASVPSKELLASVMFDLLGRIDDAAWQSLLEMGSPPILGADNVTLSALVRANFDDIKLKLRSVAQHRIDATEASVVVMGHTHQPDKFRLDGGVYFNPGCWTRYLELQSNQRVTLKDLEDETRYPYQLNYVRVEVDNSGALKSEMVCFESG